MPHTDSACQRLLIIVTGHRCKNRVERKCNLGCFVFSFAKKAILLVGAAIEDRMLDPGEASV
ncbi:hypothetical protein BJX62DRAFT_192938 [Aspergillus germanicus]